MTESYAGQRYVTVRQCEIDRLKAKLSKARHDRDQYRARCETAEQQVRWAVCDAWKEERRKVYEASVRERQGLEEQIRRLRGIVADKLIERIVVLPSEGSET